MTKEEIKQYLRNQIDSSIKTQDVFDKNKFYLCYNNSYIRVLKLSKITGKQVNKEDFKGADLLFWINTKTKIFIYHSKISNYLVENYSTDYIVQKKTIEEVMNEYSEYKGYNWGW